MVVVIMGCKPIKTNSQALRWCKRRSMEISFDNWREILKTDQIPDGNVCKLRGDPNKGYSLIYGKSLIKCVNKMIEIMNKGQNEFAKSK